MVLHTLEQRVFMYDTYVKYGSARKRVSGRQIIHSLVNKLRISGLLIDKKQIHKRRVLVEQKLESQT
jgi:hypothetical protein